MAQYQQKTPQKHRQKNVGNICSDSESVILFFMKTESKHKNLLSKYIGLSQSKLQNELAPF